MDISLKNKVIFIADLDETVGSELKVLLKAEGATVIGNTKSGFDSTVDMATKVDLLDKSSVQKLAKEISEKYGQLDGYFFNVYRCKFLALKDTTGDVFMEEVNTVTKAAFICMQVFGEAMAGINGSQALYLTTLHDQKPNGKSPLHSIAMGTISNLVLEGAIAYGRSGTHVNQLRVGPIEDMAQTFDEDNETSAFYAGVKWKTPTGIPENSSFEVAKMAAIILSGTLSWLNGSQIKLDGGLEQVYGSFKANLLAHKEMTEGEKDGL